MCVCSGYSGNGSVTAEVVFVNYGHQEDFERVKEHVAGRIALVKYLHGFRGNKVRPEANNDIANNYNNAINAIDNNNDLKC